MSQKILSAPEKYACLQRLNREDKFQEELFDLQREQMVLQQLE